MTQEAVATTTTTKKLPTINIILGGTCNQKQLFWGVGWGGRPPKAGDWMFGGGGGLLPGLGTKLIHWHESSFDIPDMKLNNCSFVAVTTKWINIFVLFLFCFSFFNFSFFFFFYSITRCTVQCDGAQCVEGAWPRAQQVVPDSGQDTTDQTALAEGFLRWATASPWWHGEQWVTLREYTMNSVLFIIIFSHPNWVDCEKRHIYMATTVFSIFRNGLESQPCLSVCVCMCVHTWVKERGSIDSKRETEVPREV